MPDKGALIIITIMVVWFFHMVWVTRTRQSYTAYLKRKEARRHARAWRVWQ